MDRLNLFRTALTISREHAKQWGQHPAIRSIIVQLEYLEAAEMDSTKDRSRLNDIIVGLLAVREIEDRDKPLSELLYKMSSEAEEMPRPFKLR